MKINKVKIAHLAPEIPALSATFVYNEIELLEAKGIEVLPISVHYPEYQVDDEKLSNLTNRTIYLYQNSGLFDLLKANVLLMVTHPVPYFKTLFTALTDSWKTGWGSRIGPGLIYRFLVASQVANILKKENCRHLHCHFAHVPADIAMYASMLSGISFSFTAHANDIFQRGWLLKEKVERSSFAVTISKFNREFLIGLGAQKEKIHVVRCGVDEDSFKSREYNILPKTIKIGSLGRLVDKKGFDVLIQACKKLKEQNFLFHLEIAGTGPLESDIKSLVDKMNLSKHVSFLGAMPHRKVAKWFESLNVFALACKKDSYNDMDGIPVVLMEAMLAGIPVVSTRISGIPELIEDCVTGCLAEPENPESLAESIKRIFKDNNFHKNIRKNAINKVRTQFNLSTNVGGLAEHLIGACHE